ncbi:MAG: hypothetical protein Q8K36_03100, partial [Alphaproteobacteria bacterium]|nr:hypothetical protein [Alphaproteobacteria bacterium]
MTFKLLLISSVLVGSVYASSTKSKPRMPKSKSSYTLDWQAGISEQMRSSGGGYHEVPVQQSMPCVQRLGCTDATPTPSLVSSQGATPVASPDGTPPPPPVDRTLFDQEVRTPTGSASSISDDDGSTEPGRRVPALQCVPDAAAHADSSPPAPRGVANEVNGVLPEEIRIQRRVGDKDRTYVFVGSDIEALLNNLLNGRIPERQQLADTVLRSDANKRLLDSVHYIIEGSTPSPAGKKSYQSEGGQPVLEKNALNALFALFDAIFYASRYLQLAPREFIEQKIREQFKDTISKSELEKQLQESAKQYEAEKENLQGHISRLQGELEVATAEKLRITRENAKTRDTNAQLTGKLGMLTTEQEALKRQMAQFKGKEKALEEKTRHFQDVE